jgi:hypothetical protein
MAGLHVPLPTLRRHPRGCLRTAWGRCGSILLHRSGLARRPAMHLFAVQRNSTPMLRIAMPCSAPLRTATLHNSSIKKRPPCGAFCIDDRKLRSILRFTVASHRSAARRSAPPRPSTQRSRGPFTGPLFGLTIGDWHLYSDYFATPRAALLLASFQLNSTIYFHLDDWGLASILRFTVASHRIAALRSAPPRPSTQR